MTSLSNNCVVNFSNIWSCAILTMPSMAFIIWLYVCKGWNSENVISFTGHQANREKFKCHILLYLFQSCNMTCELILGYLFIYLFQCFQNASSIFLYIQSWNNVYVYETSFCLQGKRKKLLCLEGTQWAKCDCRTLTVFSYSF